MITNVEIVVARKSRSFAEMPSAESGCGSPKLNRVCGFSKERPVRKSIGQKVPVRRSSSEDQAGQEFYRSIFGYHYTKRRKPSCFRCYFTDCASDAISKNTISTFYTCAYSPFDTWANRCFA